MSSRILSAGLLLMAACLYFASCTFARHAGMGQPDQMCCTRVTGKNMTSQVTGNKYHKQHAHLGCVDAVVFPRSNKMPLCADPEAEWVKELIVNKVKVSSINDLQGK